jgi:hypothetical protein
VKIWDFRLQFPFQNWASSFETGTDERVPFRNWASQIGTVMIWKQKRSSFETGQKSASSFETGTVTVWAPTYILGDFHFV